MFERFLKSAHPLLARAHGAAAADAIVAAARDEHVRLLPDVPDIGGRRNVFQPVMTVNGWLVALHRAMRARGLGAEATVRVAQRVFEDWIAVVPAPLLRGIGRLLLTAPFRRYFARQAERSRERRYAEDFVWSVEQRADGEFSFVFEECAVNKWYEAQEVRELAPVLQLLRRHLQQVDGHGRRRARNDRPRLRDLRPALQARPRDRGAEDARAAARRGRLTRGRALGPARGDADGSGRRHGRSVPSRAP